MRKTILITLCIFMSMMFLGGCKEKPKGRLETKFEEFTMRNFANPKDLLEVVTIHQIDSADYEKMISETVALHKEVNEIRDSLMQLFYKEMPEIKKSILYKDDIQRAIKNNIATVRKFQYDIALSKASAKRLEELLDSIPKDRMIMRSYEIKAKIKGETELVTYYAEDWVGIDSVGFSRDKFTKNDMPELQSQISLLMEQTMEGIKMEKKLGESFLEIFNLIKLHP